jgi:hemerythrin superfamily protein
MNAIDLLKEQHAALKALFKKIGKAEEADEKEELFTKIADDLAVHAAIEEKYFYPATKTTRTEELLREAVEEHLSQKRVIADLLDCPPDDPQFDAKIKVLMDAVQRHMEEEENDLFPKVKKLLDKDQLKTLGAQMEETAEELKAEGSPRLRVPGETAAPAPLD